MKKVFFAAVFAVLALASCKNTTTESAEVTSTDSTVVAVDSAAVSVDSVTVDTTTAKVK
jgi:hypothetical protein